MISRHFTAAAGLSLLILAAYSNSFSAGFSWDNQYLILRDPRIRAATPENIGLIFEHTYWWPTGEAGLYRPLTTLSYLFNYAILGNGERPAGYHWLNLFLHAVNALLVYALAWQLWRRYWPSLFLAAIWAVHPVLTESVTNIVGRSDLLAGAACLSALLLYIAIEKQRFLALAGLMAVTTIGAYSKESAIMIPAVLALYELTWRKDRRRLWYSLAATAPPILLMLWQRSQAIAASAPAEFPFTDNPIVAASAWTAKLTAVRVIVRYLWLTVWPAKLSIDYSYSQIPIATGSAQDWLAVILVAALVAAVALLYRRHRTAFFFACFAVLTFLPTSNLIFPIGTIMAERFLYAPIIGLLGCLVIGVEGISKRRWLAPAVFGVIAATGAAGTWMRNQDWQDDFHLVTASLQASPNSYKLHKVLASSLYSSDPAHSNIDQATAEAEKALAILNSLPNAQNDADTYRWSGGFYLSKGDALAKRNQDGAPSYERARELLFRCLAIQNAHDKTRAGSKPEVYRLLSAVQIRLGHADEAVRTAKVARDLDPFAPEAYRQMAEAALAKQNGDAAAVALMTGFLVTSNEGVKQDLLSLYQSGLDVAHCAVVAGPRGPAMNPSCEMVRRHVCAASVDVVQAYLRRGRREQAQAQRQALVNNFGCPAAPLDTAIASP